MLIVKSAYFFNLSYPQMNDFGDLLGTLYAPVSKKRLLRAFARMRAKND